MVRLHEAGPLATAQNLAAKGLQVLPARYQDKAPIVKWAEYQRKSTINLLPTWFGGGTKRNFWVMTGHVSKHVVVDCDDEAAETWWRQQIGDDVMDAASTVRTRKGRHFWFRIPEDWTKPIPSWANHTDEVSFDFRADDTGVIVPPSVHASGHQYVWEKPLEETTEAPLLMLDGTVRAAAAAATAQGQDGTTEPRGGHTRSLLSRLLQRPPGGEGTGRNDWLARVAGHYAKTYHNQRDLYDAHCESANLLMGKPLDEAEYSKTIESIWRGEHERNKQRALDADCGWLQSAGTKILTQVVIKAADGEGRSFELEEYADFDLVAKGVMLAEDQSRTYWVQIIRQKRGSTDHEVIDAVLAGHVLGDDRQFRKWLAGFACTVMQPENMWPKQGSTGIRMQRYLESQQPPAVKVTSTLGWDEEILDGRGGFVTHSGIITAEEVYDCEMVGVRPNPALLVGKMAPHEYGFEADHNEARRVLEEVLTFHDDITTSVFGAWWAACLVKPQIEHRTSLFPFMAIEAPSESGKTNGYFELMTQLNGNTRGETQPTKAALRDMAAAHRNGIVWVDDLDDPAYLMELLRAATSGGSLTKMGEDRESVKNTRIVSPVVISGEALGLGTQKALLDRAIILKVGSPTNRKSRHNPDRPQWDDVLALREQYPRGLSSVAGWFVQDALRVLDPVIRSLKEVRNGSGRAADKVAILCTGARLLDYLVATNTHERDLAWRGKGPHSGRVTAWLEQPNLNAAGAEENALTLHMIPWALRTFHYPAKAQAGDNHRDLDTPVFVRDGSYKLARTIQELLAEPLTPEGPQIWFNTALLAQAWEREKHGRIERRTETESALKDQANALGAPARRWKISGGGGRLAYYRKIDGELATKMLRRAQGMH